MVTIYQFLQMGHYAVYIWPAYGSVLLLLSLLWFISWRRWRNCLDESETHE